jgi:BirA family biotin operon repressor/biotin-[acetyl-CoA-carboxylase] ligase
LTRLSFCVTLPLEAKVEEFSAEAIRGALTTRRLGRPVLFYAAIGSTNDVARAQAEAGAPEGLLVIADEQTAGRGRLNRAWWAPPGSSLLFSLLLRPPLPPGQVAQLTMCLGLGAAEGVEEVSGLRPALKWPNDLLLDGRKLAGILTELDTAGERLEYAVVGLGLNVNLSPFDRRRACPERSEGAGPCHFPNAISLQMALHRPVTRLPLLAAILARCEAWYDRLLAGESPHTAWAARLDTMGHQITIMTPGGMLRGVAVGVSPEGALLVRQENGQVCTVWAGDVATARST